MMDSCVGLCVENSTRQLSSDSSFRQPDSMNMSRMINEGLLTEMAGLFPARALANAATSRNLPIWSLLGTEQGDEGLYAR